MKAKLSILGVTIMAFLILTGVVYAAPVTIDSFTVEGQSLRVGGTDGSTDSGVTANNAGILGGERDAYLELLFGTSSSNLDINAGGSGIVAFSAGSGSLMEATIVWDGDDDDADPITGVDYTGLSGEDLTAGGTNDGIALTIYDWEGNALDISVTVYSDSSNFSTATLALRGNAQIDPPGEPYGFSFDDDFVIGSGASGPADFTNAGAIVLEIITIDTGGDVSLDLALATATRDFGDLPADYGITTVAENGARHTEDAVYLGTARDTEVNGTPSPLASGDDDDGTDDEDGVTRIGTWVDGTNGATVEFAMMTPTGVACVDGWIDWNNDNDFDDAGEHVIDSLLLFDGRFGDNLTQSFDVPVGTFAGSGNTLFARWRIAPDSNGNDDCSDEINLSYVGPASGGEVEDYDWVFSPSAISLGAFDVNDGARALPLGVVAALLFALVGTGVVVYGRQRIR